MTDLLLFTSKFVAVFAKNVVVEEAVMWTKVAAFDIGVVVTIDVVEDAVAVIKVAISSADCTWIDILLLLLL